MCVDLQTGARVNIPPPTAASEIIVITGEKTGVYQAAAEIRRIYDEKVTELLLTLLFFRVCALVFAGGSFRNRIRQNCAQRLSRNCFCLLVQLGFTVAWGIVLYGVLESVFSLPSRKYFVAIASDSSVEM